MRLEIIQTPGINALKKTLSFPGEAIAVFMASGDGRKYAEWADAYAAGYRLVELNDDTDGRMEKRISALERQLDASRLAAMEWRARFEEASAMLAAPQPAPSVEDYTEVIADNARLLRELDVALNGANAAKQAPSVEKAICWPAGYCLDPNGRMVTPAGKHEDFAFGYEIGSAEAMAIKAHATQAKSAPAPSVPDGWRLVRSLLDEIDALVGETGGVYGLHQNGDASPWDEILPGGQFERLSSLDDVREIIDAEQPSETAAGLLLAGMIEDEI